MHSVYAVKQNYKKIKLKIKQSLWVVLEVDHLKIQQRKGAGKKSLGGCGRICFVGFLKVHGVCTRQKSDY